MEYKLVVENEPIPNLLILQEILTLIRSSVTSYFQTPHDSDTEITINLSISFYESTFKKVSKYE